MPTWTQVAGRLGVARLALADVPPQYHAATSSTQMRSCLSLLAGVKLADEECAEAMRLVVQCKWHGADGQTVADAILKQGAAQLRGAKRKLESSMQDYTAIANMLTGDDWSALLAEGVACSVKRDRLIFRLSKLGCRNPDERTSKLVTSILLMVTQPWSACQGMPACVKAQNMKAWKDEFKRQTRHTATPTTWLQTLPNCVEHFRVQHAGLFADVYGHAAPVKCQLDWQQLQLLNSSYTCRTGQARANQVLLSGGAQPQPGGQMEQFGNMLLQGMSQMYKQQQQMMEFMFRGQQSSLDIPMRFAAHTGFKNRCDLAGSTDSLLQATSSEFPALQDAANASEPAAAKSHADAHSCTLGSSALAVLDGASGDVLATQKPPQAPEGGKALLSSVCLMDLLEKRAAAKATKSAAKGTEEAASEVAELIAPEATPAETKKLKKTNKKKKKKKALVAIADATAVPAALAAEKKAPKLAATAVGKKASKPPKTPLKATGPTPAPGTKKKGAAPADPTMSEPLTKLNISNSKGRLEITSATKSKPRLCLVTMQTAGKAKKVEEFVSAIKKMVAKGACKADVIELRRKLFAPA
eukprot:TRINITY_DN3737_c0_g1_i1.p1 TRINITY_DN3737_c0_g1~~TRINITY_DN3737_c0_g1_i1.p1  ORF type:complete len:584 (+),score=162.04 TRINITY_DN3737_c0_g1_i1:96-1847(+)